MTIRISPRAIHRFFLLVLAIDVLLILITGLSDVGVPFTQRVQLPQFDLKREGTFAVWYSSLLLLLVSAAAFGIGKANSTPLVRTAIHRWSWYAVAVVFLGLSIDETAQLHERAGLAFSRRFGVISGLTDGASPAFGWLVLAVPAVFLFLIGMILAVRSLPAFHSRSRLLAFSGVACWTGVICAEVIEAQLRRWAMSRSIQGVVEEGLEIAGTTLFLMSFVEILRDRDAPGVARVASSMARSESEGPALFDNRVSL
jgi:hypothetical protein